ncbi:LOW QUALITY PROTEIN: alpha-N-acetylgalactosaminide alpha-2,6-sialyltransferase 1 [Ciconia maguari]
MILFGAIFYCSPEMSHLFEAKAKRPSVWKSVWCCSMASRIPLSNDCLSVSAEGNTVRQLSIFQHAPDVLQVDSQENSDNGNSSFLKVTLGRDITRLKQDMVERTPRWREGKEEQKKMTKPVARVEEDKENMTVKPPPRLEGIKKTTVKTAPMVQSNKEKTTVRPAPGVEEAKEKTVVKPLPRVEGAKEKATVKPSSGVKGAHENNTSKDQTKPKEPPASVKTVRPVPQAAAVTEKKKLRAADFKSELRWDFEDKYLLDNSSPPSTCSESVKAKAAKSDWLRDLFLPNIMLFTERYYNDGEWDRLEHFAPLYGFIELNYSLVEEIMSLLPPNPHQQLLLANSNSSMPTCISCAVVGNGGILNNSGMGQEIDSHDYVFWVSGAVIKGYEKDVGTKTSFYGFTAYSLVSSLQILGHRGFSNILREKHVRYIHFLEGARDYEWLKALLLNQNIRKGFLNHYGQRPRERLDEDFTMDEYLVVHPDFLRYMKNRFLKSKSLEEPYWRLYRPTMGAFLLLTALRFCDQVSACGYITAGHKKYSDHYYDKDWKHLIFYLNRDFSLEKQVWKKLHDENLMKRHHTRYPEYHTRDPDCVARAIAWEISRTPHWERKRTTRAKVSSGLPGTFHPHKDISLLQHLCSLITFLQMCKCYRPGEEQQENAACQQRSPIWLCCKTVADGCRHWYWERRIQDGSG